MGTAVRNRQVPATTTWDSTQAYSMAAVCLVLGVAIGFIVRGSSFEPTPTSSGPVAVANAGPMQAPGMGGMPGGVQPAELVDKAAQPLLDTLKTSPKDATILAKLGDLYYDARLYRQATSYYEQALTITPSNANVRTDMATAFYYVGNTDRALAEYEKSLSYSPNHANTLLNMGVVKWQGKKDAKGAIAAWERLLRTNPGFAGRDRVEQLIQEAKQTAG